MCENRLAKSRGRCLFPRLFGAILLVSIGAVAFAFLHLGNWLSSPAGDPAKADVIVTLGGDNGERVMLAASLYHAGFADRILLTGMEGGSDATRMHYLNWRTQYLIDSGIPNSAFLFDGRSANTHQEAEAIAALLAKKDWKRAIIVSDPPHMRRLKRTFKPVFSEANIDLILVATEAPTWDPHRWWRDEKWAQFSLMEVIKLAHYAIKY